MSNDNTQLFRIEVLKPTGEKDCYQCLHADQIGEIIAPIAGRGEEATGTVIEIFDYQSWQPGLQNKSLIKFQAV